MMFEEIIKGGGGGAAAPLYSILILVQKVW